MHRSFSPRCDKAVPRNPSLRQPALSGRARIWQWASALAAGMAVAACGGGGGGGDAPSTTNTPPGSTVSSSAAPFPIGMSMASPTALAASSSVIAGGLGIVNLGFNTIATTTQSVLSSQVDALATGRLTLVPL